MLFLMIYKVLVETKLFSFLCHSLRREKASLTFLSINAKETDNKKQNKLGEVISKCYKVYGDCVQFYSPCFKNVNTNNKSNKLLIPLPYESVTHIQILSSRYYRWLFWAQSIYVKLNFRWALKNKKINNLTTYIEPHLR